MSVVKFSPKREKQINVLLSNHQPQGNFEKDSFFALLASDDIKPPISASQRWIWNWSLASSQCLY